MPHRGYLFVEKKCMKIGLPRQGLPFANSVAPDGAKDVFWINSTNGQPRWG
jgi:hypothetical protein